MNNPLGRVTAQRAQKALARHLSPLKEVRSVDLADAGEGSFVLLVDADEATLRLLRAVPERVDGITTIILDRSLLGVPPSNDTVKECPCQVTMRVMAALGAPKTARMHARLGEAWSFEDWTDHFFEEEKFFLPLLRARGFSREAARIEEEHKIFLRHYRLNGRWLADALDEHAAFEDYLVSTFLSDLDPKNKSEKK